MIGRGSPPLCAVQAVVSYLARRGSRPGPLFLFENGLPLTCSLLTDRLRAILLSAGLPGNSSSHSFRIKAGTSAARVGLPDHLKIWAAGKVMLTNNIFELHLML